MRPENGRPSSDGSTRHWPLTPFDDGRLARLAHVDRLHRALRPAGPGDAEGAQPPLVTGAPRLLGGDDRVVGVDPRRQIPQPLPSLPAGDRDLAPLHHEVEQLLDVAVVGPPGRLPGHRAGVRQLAHRQRPRAFSRARMSRRQASLALTQSRRSACHVAQLAPPGPVRHVGAVEREVFRGPDHRLELEERPVLEGAAQLRRGVRRSQAAPRDQVGARGDRGDRVELEQAQVPHQLEQPGRSLGVEQLGLHGDPARVGPGELVDGAHAPRLGWRRLRVMV